MQKKWLLCTTLFNIHASKILVNGHEYVIFARKILSLTWKKTTRRKIIRKSTKIREKKGQRAFMHKYKQLYKKILHHHKPANQSIVHSILLKRTSVHFILHQILFTIVFLFCLSFFLFVECCIFLRKNHWFCMGSVVANIVRGKYRKPIWFVVSMYEVAVWWSSALLSTCIHSLISMQSTHVSQQVYVFVCTHNKKTSQWISIMNSNTHHSLGVMKRSTKTKTTTNELETTTASILTPLIHRLKFS